MSDKAIVLLSGGVDSAICLYWAKNQNYDVSALTLNYYDRWVREIESSRELSRSANTRLIEVEIPFVKEAFNVLGYDGGYVKDGDVRWPFYIPAKNLMFYSVAAHYAEYMNARWIVGGHNKHDMQFYADATKGYISMLNRLLKDGCMLCDGSHYQITAPLADMEKRQVITLGMDMHVPLELTWSCHKKTEKHCGKCYGCKSRIEAFRACGAKDPVEYA
ncbi:MAG: 7-cyano-7-deazaguanine synthase [Nitrososphaerales archaeon]